MKKWIITLILFVALAGILITFLFGPITPKNFNRATWVLGNRAIKILDEFEDTFPEINGWLTIRDLETRFEGLFDLDNPQNEKDAKTIEVYNALLEFASETDGARGTIVGIVLHYDGDYANASESIKTKIEEYYQAKQKLIEVLGITDYLEDYTLMN